MKFLTKKERRLRHIARLEYDLEIFPPWHYILISEPYQWGYRVPTQKDIDGGKHAK